MPGADDYDHRPVTELLRGPLLHTPQGIMVLLSSAVYLLVAGCIVLLDIDTWSGWQVGNWVPLCLTWPFLLFIYFIKDNSPAFAPSWGGAAWLGFYALLPVLFSIYHTWLA